MIDAAVSPPAARLAFHAVSRTHCGARRAVNEDRVLERSDSGLWAVADGMGGHKNGAVAAARLIDALESVDDDASGYARVASLEREVQAVNASFFADHRGPAPQASGGSTLVALLAHEGHFACIWAGDSRAYVWRDGRLSAISHDHSVVQQLVDKGSLSEGERWRHPMAHVITRAVGAAPSLELERRFAPILADDVFLLCSDGLTVCLGEDEIAGLLEGADLDAAADALLALTLARGAPDNVSFVLIRAQ